MNKDLLLELLIAGAESMADEYQRARPTGDLQEALNELNSRRPIKLPLSLPSKAEKMLPLLKQHFHDRVSLISLVLSHYFHDRFFVYRATLEQEIFDGLAFFADLVPGFRFTFTTVGNHVDRYLKLNESLQAFARDVWPDESVRQYALMAFLYDGLGMLFLEKSSYNRYWIMATGPEYFKDLDTESETTWSGKKEMKVGDLVFMYRTSPRKAITNIYRVKNAPRFDPWGAWDGVWVDLSSLGPISDIPFREMRADPVLQEWGLIRRQFQWTVTEAIPHVMYNRLLSQIPPDLRSHYNLVPEPVASTGTAGTFTSEAEFEDKIVKPLLRRWGFEFKAQHPCLFRFGSQESRGRVDCFVSDGRGPLTLFEDKLRIANDRELEPAVAQARSYALMLGLPSFVVAAPEGLWIYSLNRNIATLRQHIPTIELPEQEANARRLLLSLRT